ncbi:MAG TPA: hypothetical protein VH164_12905, partial [Ktedonobacteraceae bacterium]|nr:hypothetical protein [Ktedonobacteraceae bacterium]
MQRVTFHLRFDPYCTQGDNERSHDYGGYNSMFSRLSGHTHVSPLSARPAFWSRISCFTFCLVLCALLAACGQGTTTSAQPAATPTVAHDVYGKPITFQSTAPQRIVSLTPSMSEILGALHLENRVVGIDYYTTYPAD